MSVVVKALYLIVAVVNLLPVVGVTSRARLEALYGVTLDDPNLVILMRHRAILLGIVGALLAVAAFEEPLRPAASVAGFVSMLSFVAIAYGTPDRNAQLRRVAKVDIFASVLLVGATVLSLD